MIVSFGLSLLVNFYLFQTLVNYLKLLCKNTGLITGNNLASREALFVHALKIELFPGTKPTIVSSNYER